MKRLQILLTLLAAASLAGGGYFAYNERSSRDVNPPELKSSVDLLEVSIHATDEEMMAPITAIDAEDGDVSDSILIEQIRIQPENDPEDDAHLFTIKYAAFDSVGNSSELELDLKFTDYRSPHFTVQDQLIFLEGSNIDLLKYFVADDVLDGDITPFITIEGADRLAESPTPGIYSCTISARNSAGDTAVLPINVLVKDSSYVSSLQPSIYLTDYLIYLKKGEKFEPTAYLDYVQESGYCQIDYGDMVEQLDSNGNAVLDKNGNPVYITEKVANGSKEKWVNISQINTSGVVNTSEKGIYTVQYIFTSMNTGYTAENTLTVVVE